MRCLVFITVPWIDVIDVPVERDRRRHFGERGRSFVRSFVRPPHGGRVSSFSSSSSFVRSRGEPDGIERNPSSVSSSSDFIRDDAPMGTKIGARNRGGVLRDDVRDGGAGGDADGDVPDASGGVGTETRAVRRAAWGG